MRSPRKSFKLPKPQRQDVCAEPPQEAHSSLGNTTDLCSPADGVRFGLRQLVDHAGELLPGERVARCGKIFRRGEFETTAQYNTETGKARLTNLCRCGMGQVCPICALYQSMRDAQALAWACSDPRYTPVLVTYTASHHIDDTLADWDTAFNAVCHEMKGGKFWVGLCKDYGVVHTVWDKEFTWSLLNGWHPHRHTIFFLRGDVDEAALRRLEVALRLKYDKVLARHGLAATWERGVKVSAKTHDISEYIAKFGRLPQHLDWDIEQEVAHANIKEGRREGKSPFELLGDSLLGDERAGELFVEFAAAVKGRKRLNWSKGAKADLLSGERPMPKEQAVPGANAWIDVVTVSREKFDVLVQLRLIDALLSIVVSSQGNAVAVMAWLDEKLAGRLVNINELMWAQHERLTGLPGPP